MLQIVKPWKKMEIKVFWSLFGHQLKKQLVLIVYVFKKYSAIN